MTAVPFEGSPSSDFRFLRICVTAMAVVLVSGFVVNLAFARSSFNAPLVVHVHAVVFMGWVGITVTQVWLAASGAVERHRLLGKLALVWVFGLIVLGPLVTYEAVRTQSVPFFFQPQHFLVANPVTLLGFVGLFAAAVAMRKRTDWHSRLQIGAFVMLMGPGLGRLLPMPFLVPYAYEIAVVPALIVPLIGMAQDQRVHGRVHPAWWMPIIAVVGLLLISRLIAFSPLGDGIYAWATAGTPAEGTSGLEFPPPAASPPASP